MPGLDPIEDTADSTVFRDVLMLALLGFVTIVMLLLPHLNPPTHATEETRVHGNVIVEVRWPEALDADVDLWVQAPGQRPVGYSNKGGPIFNLLRDDLGRAGDPTDLNYEVAFGRGTPPGEYTVNLHLYSNGTGRLPVPAVVVVGVKAGRDGALRRIVAEQVELGRVGEERTVTRFTLDEAGNAVPGSTHRLQRALRSARR